MHRVRSFWTARTSRMFAWLVFDSSRDLCSQQKAGGAVLAGTVGWFKGKPEGKPKVSSCAPLSCI